MSSHHHKKQRQVGAAACPITVQVDPKAHLVAVFTGIKGWKYNTTMKCNNIFYSSIEVEILYQADAL